MFENRIELRPKDILEKEFKIDTHGFRLKEVDEFLDIIMGDYEEFIEISKEYEAEKLSLQQEIIDLKQEIRNLETKLDIVGSETAERREVTNVDILKRLSQLEKIVYEKET